MQTEYESSRIERAKRGLYGTDQAREALRKEELSPSDLDVSDDWGDTEILTEREVRRHKNGVRILKYLVILAITMTFASGGYLLYQLFDPFSKPSEKNILVTFDVPTGITPGVPADVLVRVSNQNRVGVEYGNLTLVYPPGTKQVEDPTRDMRDTKKILEAIPAGGSTEFHTRAIFLGEENSDRELRVTLDYRFERMSSMFSKTVSHPLHLIASPINLTVDVLKQVNSGQTMEIGINSASNTVIPLNDVLVKIEYPQDFTFTDASPKPTFGNNIWRIGTMNPSDKFAVKIRGVLSGVDSQEKVFHVSVGAGSDQTERDVSTIYAKSLSSILIKEPFIGVNLALNGVSAEESVSHFGQSAKGTVSWRNNLRSRITNAQIEVRLSGAPLDRSSILVSDGGFYRSSDDVIIWEKRGNPQLEDVPVGASGFVNFSFAPLASVTGGQLFTNPTIVAQVTVRGQRLSEAGVPEEIKTIITKNLRISSEAQFASRAVHFTGPFVNTGPVPPRVDQETTYSVIWTIRNTSNAITNSEVRALLPIYMSWAGSVSPSGADVTYNALTHEVVWHPGDIPAGAGLDTPPKEVAFQLILTPSLSQVGKKPIILSDINFSGTDSFTNEATTQKADNLTTELSTDPKADRKSAEVMP